MDKVKKVRLDTYLVEKGFFESRAKAQASIMAGQVLVNEQKIDKPGTSIKEGAAIRLLGDQLKYVSRGGLKLEKALQVFPVKVEGKVMADIGASTGGFTDCALQNGATKVYAVDVGYGQLAWKLRSDPRVVNMERTNARALDETSLPELVDAVSIDVAFISLEKILPAVKKILKPKGFVIALIKPQFEAGKEHIGKKGVVKDPEVHKEVINRIIRFAKAEGWSIGGLDFSPVKGPEGNIEYLLYLLAASEETAAQNKAVHEEQTTPDAASEETHLKEVDALSIAEKVVAASHAALDK